MRPSPGQLPLERPQPYPMAAFDLEIAKEVPDGEDWAPFRPFGVACAAIAVESDIPGGEPSYEFFTDRGPDVAGRLLARLAELAETHAIVGFNSASFDFDVLAEETGDYATCARLAFDHYDLIHHVLVAVGYKKSLDSCCEGSGIQGKAHAVRLNDGTLLESMSGREAPRMWGAGEHSAVLAYLKEDVRATLELAMAMRDTGQLSWVTNKGKPYSSSFSRLYTVREALGMKMPYQGWMGPPWPSPAEDMKWALEYDEPKEDGHE